jgi:hypothetical protein
MLGTDQVQLLGKLIFSGSFSCVTILSRLFVRGRWRCMLSRLLARETMPDRGVVWNTRSSSQPSDCSELGREP